MNYTQDEILNLYKSRLLNITSQNKALSFRIPKSGKDAVDMYFLKDFNSNNFFNGTDKTLKITQKQYIEYKTSYPEFKILSSQEKNCKIEEIKDEFEKIKNKCEKLVKQQETVYKETGNNVLFIVNDFISGVINNGQKKIKMYAPLFLIPISIVINHNSLEIIKREEDIILNRTLFIAIMKYYKAKFHNITEFYFPQYNSQLRNLIIDEINKEELINLIENKELEKFPTSVTEFKIDESCFMINKHIVLSCIPLMSEIYTDYERMNGEINETGSTLLSEEVADGPITDEIKKEYENDEQNKKVFAITKLDKSQEFAVYMAQKSNNLVLYGPPGTGKSETILNIIADQLYRDKKILVVSEKKAAINVIYNRLSNLQNLAIMIDSNSYNYNKFKMDLMSKLKSNNSNYSEKEKISATKNMEYSLKYFNEIHKLLSTEYCGQSISEWFYVNKPQITIPDEDLIFDICKKSNIRKIFDLTVKDFEVFANNASNMENITLYKKLTNSQYEYEIMKYIFESELSPFILKKELNNTRKIVECINQEIDNLTTEKQLISEKFDKLIYWDDKLTSIKTDKQEALKDKDNINKKILNLKTKYFIEDKTASSIKKEIESQESMFVILNENLKIFKKHLEEIDCIYKNLKLLENKLLTIDHNIKNKKKIKATKETNTKNLEYIFKEKATEKEKLQNSILKFLNNKNISNLQNEILDLSNQITEKQMEISDIDEELFSLEKNKMELSQQIDTLKDDISNKQSIAMSIWNFKIPNNFSNLFPDIFEKEMNSIIKQQLDLCLKKIKILKEAQIALEQIDFELNPQIISIEKKIEFIKTEEIPLLEEVEKIKKQIFNMNIPEILNSSNFRELKNTISSIYDANIKNKIKDIEQEYEKTKELKYVKNQFNIKDINDNSLVNTIINYESLRDDFRKLNQLSQDIFSIFEYLNNKSLLNENTLELLIKIYYYLKISEIDEKFGDELCKIEHYKNIQNIYIENEDKYLSYAAAEIIDVYNSKSKMYNEYSKKEEKELKEFYSELDKKRSRLKMRQFIEKFINIILKNFPVLLITPDALSKYIPLEKDMFDIIIFDEASQLLVEKAIPGIYRSKDMIVVGDNKQLQPTQFFKSQSDVEDEIEMFFEDKSGIMDFSPDSIEEKSLLNVAQSKYNSVRLLFHYRSKFSELIQFSNHVFYHGELQLAPNISRKNENKSIKRYFVPDGLFQNGINEKEAHTTVNLLHKILKEKDPNHTIGIITFNAKQKELLEELITEKTISNKEFSELYLKEYNRIENFEDKSIFIKNIENVQGDERDIIIFTIGYGFNNKGKLSTNFGPLSLAGGENRLNVAVTRAKREIHIVTSFEPELLDVSESKNDGSRIFKSYLEYTKYISENHIDIANSTLEQYHINKEKPKSQEMFKNNLEKQIYEELTKYGLIIDTQIGDCGFDIDLAILDPATNEYVLGIECDGNDYLTSINAKERDIQRKAFLKSHKWNIYNVWSVLWYKNKQKIIDEILSIIKNEANNNNTVDYFSFQTITKKYEPLLDDQQISNSLDIETNSIQEFIIENNLQKIDQIKNDKFKINEKPSNSQLKKVIRTYKKELAIVGTDYNNRASSIENICIGDTVSIRREFTNVYDINAMSVWHNKKKIGYISKITAKTLAPLLDNEKIRIKTAIVKNLLKESQITNQNMRPHVDLILEIDELEIDE